MKELTGSITVDLQLQPKEFQLYDMMRNSDHSLIGYGGSRGGSKALDVSTHINMFDGSSKSMGDICVDDVVIDDMGGAVKILAVTDPKDEPNCYAMKFSTGETIVANEDHIWHLSFGGGLIATWQLFDIWKTKKESIWLSGDIFLESMTWLYGTRRVRCITVDNQRGMFLCGKTNIPTHNSHAARSCAIVRRLDYPGSSALVFRKTYDDLWQNHIMEIMKEWPDLYRKCWDAENKTLRMPGGGMVIFRYADTMKDVLEMKGPGYDDVFIDEASDLEPMAISILMGLNRSTREDIKPRCVLTFNPGGPSHNEMKRLFITKDWSNEERYLNPAFIQAYSWDNVYWVIQALKADGIPIAEWYMMPRQTRIDYLLTRSDYGKKLNAMPPALRDQWLYGEWDTFAGQMFTFRRRVHVVKTSTPPAHWERWGMNDPGYNDPGVWHCMCTDHDGNVYVYREFTFNIGEKIQYSEQARIVHEATKDEDISYWVTGGDALMGKGFHNESIIDQYIKGGLHGFVIGDHAKGCLSRRAAIMHEYLKIDRDGFGNESSRLKIMECCPKLIETLPSLPIDPAKPEQVLPCTIDHWYENVGRGTQYKHAQTLPQEKKYADGTFGAIDGSNKDDEDGVDEGTMTPLQKFFKMGGPR